VNRFNARVALVAAVAVALGAIVGSASALLSIGTQAGMSVPWSLPVGLDAVAIVAATAVRRRRTDRLAWATLLAATGLSTWLQVLAAPDGLVNRLAHAVPPVAVLVSFELFLRATETSDEAGTTPPTAAPVETAPSASAPALALVETTPDTGPQTATAAVRSRPVPLARTTSRAATPAPNRPRPGDRGGELVALAETVADRLAAEGRSLSRRSLQDGLKAAGRPVGTTKAGQLVDHLRNRPAPQETPT
jgi:hypothetical protein